MNRMRVLFMVFVIIALSCSALILSGCEDENMPSDPFFGFFKKQEDPAASSSAMPDHTLAPTAAPVKPADTPANTLAPTASAYESLADIIALYPGAEVDISEEAQYKASRANGAVYYTKDDKKTVVAFYDKAFEGKPDIVEAKTQDVIEYSFGHSSGDEKIPKLNVAVMQHGRSADSGSDIIYYLTGKDVLWHDQEFYKVEGY